MLRPEASQTLPSETTLGQSFMDWLKSIFRNGNFFAIHSDHLGTPRLMTNENNKPVWQWPYSAFGANKPTGILTATPNPRVAITNQPVLLKATAATELNLRFPGQYFDSETNLHYNYFRSYQPNQGRYTQADPIGLDGGLNRFGYVAGDPLRSIDPRGLILETLWDVGNLAYDLWNGNWEDAAWDAAAVCLPGVPAGMTKLGNLTKKARNAPPKRLPEAEGRPHTIIESQGPGGQYTTYKPDGTWMQYRGSGKDHGPIPRPNVKEQTINFTPDGRTFQGDRVRPPKPGEIPK